MRRPGDQLRLVGVSGETGDLVDVRFHGDKQSGSIRPTEGTDVANVAITLRKG